TFYLLPEDFWADLGIFIRQICTSHPGMSTKEGIFATTLRELIYYLYIAWNDMIKDLSSKKPKIDFVKELKNLIDRKH
ncbi:MAG: hypothetical protein ACKO96_48930, partial [Flammeovirgaceae bacterium]